MRNNIKTMEYREATPDERALLDQAREKLVTAFLIGDDLTLALATQAIRKTLKGMERGKALSGSVHLEGNNRQPDRRDHPRNGPASSFPETV